MNPASWQEKKLLKGTSVRNLNVFAGLKDAVSLLTQYRLTR